MFSLKVTRDPSGRWLLLRVSARNLEGKFQLSDPERASHTLDILRPYNLSSQQPPHNFIIPRSRSSSHAFDLTS